MLGSPRVGGQAKTTVAAPSAHCQSELVTITALDILNQQLNLSSASADHQLSRNGADDSATADRENGAISTTVVEPRRDETLLPTQSDDILSSVIIRDRIRSQEMIRGSSRGSTRTDRVSIRRSARLESTLSVRRARGKGVSRVWLWPRATHVEAAW